MATIEENRQNRVTAPPSLLGSAGSAAPKAENLKILSALQSSPAAPWSRARTPFVIALAACTIAGAGVWAWSAKETSGEEPLVASAAPVVAPSVDAVPAAPVAPAASAAIIETLPVAALPAAPLEATAVASPQPTPPRLAAAQTAPGAAAGVPARHHTLSTPSPRRHSATRTASARSKKPPVTRKEQEQRAAKEADVDLLEAMMAHVHGDSAAAAK